MQHHFAPPVDGHGSAGATGISDEPLHSPTELVAALERLLVERQGLLARIEDGEDGAPEYARLEALAGEIARLMRDLATAIGRDTPPDPPGAELDSHSPPRG